MTCTALIVAAGKSLRFGGDIPKQYKQLAGRPVLSWTIDRFERCPVITDIVIVIETGTESYVSEKVIEPYAFLKIRKLVPGGEHRADSVLAGLESLNEDTRLVAIHDGARPLTAPADIERVVRTARDAGAALLAARATDTIKRIEDDFVIATLDRERIYQAQTPQVFWYELILDAHRKAVGSSVTDDCSVVERLGHKVCVVEPTGPNFKVTTPHDLQMAAAILAKETA
jgi:2-C-methyl-D-erythritol 4-phosphate cytidylyltransferase